MIPRRSSLKILVLISAVIVAGCSRDMSVLATVGDTEVTVSEFESSKNSIASSLDPAQQKSQILNTLIDRKVQLHLSRQAGYEQDPEIVHAIENLLIAKLRQNELNSIINAVTVSDADVDAYYQKNIKKYTSSAMIRGAMIFLALPSNADNEIRLKVQNQANNILTLAKTQPASVKGFGSLAQKHSQDQATRYVGGDMGWLSTKEKIVAIAPQNPILMNALQQLNNKGDLSQVITTSDGLYLLKLVDSKPALIKPLSVVASNIKQRLLHNNQQQAEADWLQGLRHSVTPLEIHNKALSLVNLPTKGKKNNLPRPPELPY